MMGLRYAGDPDWAYRLPRTALLRAIAAEDADAEETLALRAHVRRECGPDCGYCAAGVAQAPERPGPPGAAKGSLFALPQVNATPEAVAFWSKP